MVPLSRFAAALIAVALTASVGCGGTSSTAPADDVSYGGTLPSTTGFATLTIGGTDRRVYVYVPAGLGAKPPLVVALHGTGANIDDGALDSAVGELGVREVADANGFVVVAPFSTSDGGVNADHDGGGDGWRFGGDANSNLDLALVRASIQEAHRVFAIDTSRVYAVGHSNGAFFSYFVATKLSDRIAAFAENSGGLIPCGQRVDCNYAAPGATSCGEVLAAAPSACTCAIGASPFPTAKAGHEPQGFLKHNADDTTVSAAFSCRLAEYLGDRAQITIDPAGEHGVTNDFMTKAWSFLAARSLGD